MIYFRQLNLLLTSGLKLNQYIIGIINKHWIQRSREYNIYVFQQMDKQLQAKIKKRQEAQGFVVDEPVKKTPEKITQPSKGNSEFEANKNRLKAFFEQKQGGGGGSSEPVNLPLKQEIKGNSEEFANARKMLEMNMGKKTGVSAGLPPPPPPPSLGNLPPLPNLPSLPPPPSLNDLPSLPPPPSFDSSSSSDTMAPPPRLSQVLGQPSSSSSSNNVPQYQAVQPKKTTNVPTVQAKQTKSSSNNVSLPPPPPPPSLQTNTNNNTGFILPPPPPPPAYNQPQTQPTQKTNNSSAERKYEGPGQQQNRGYVHQPIFNNNSNAKSNTSNNAQQQSSYQQQSYQQSSYQQQSSSSNTANLPPPHPPYLNEPNKDTYNQKSAAQSSFNYYAKGDNTQQQPQQQYQQPQQQYQQQYQQQPTNTKTNTPSRQLNPNQVNTGRTPPKTQTSSGDKKQRQQIFNSPSHATSTNPNLSSRSSISSQFFNKDVAGYLKKEFIKQVDIMGVIGTMAKKSVHAFYFPSIENQVRNIEPNETIYADVESLNLASCYRQKNMQSIKPHSMARDQFVTMLKSYNWNADPEKLKLVQVLAVPLPTSTRFVQPNFTYVKQGLLACDKIINNFVKFQNFNGCAEVKKLKDDIEKGIGFYIRNPQGNQQTLEDVYAKLKQIKEIKRS